MSSERVYKKASSFEESVAFLKSECGRIFDPKMVETFMDNLEEIRRIKMAYQDNPEERRWIE